MKKRLLALLLAGVMALSFTACGETGAKTNTPAPTSPAKANTPAPSKAAETTPEPTATPTPIPVETLSFKESPVLAAEVKAGTLPAIEKRIPDKDNVYVDSVDATGKKLEIGTYGGNLNLVYGGGSWDLSRVSLESIIRYNSDGTYFPNVIKSFEHNDDYTVWTFHLREGMKWSDGDDFNADDITFWYYMCHINNYDSKASWTALKDGDGNFAVLKKVDDYTVTWTFGTPKYPADFIENGDFKWCWAPSHFLKDLIPASLYVENEYWANTGLSDEQVLLNAQNKTVPIDFSSVTALGKEMLYYSWNISGMPSINSFVLTTKAGNNTRKSALCILERNKYFWKVDAEGNQLPYVDNLYLNKIDQEGHDELMFRSGELDMIEVAMDKISGIMNDMGSKVYRVEMTSANWGTHLVTFNYTCKDSKYAELFANPDFRRAISISVDREELSGLTSNGFLEPGQCAPQEGNFGYDEEWINKWTEYDVAAAKKLLEGCGLKMGSDGFYDFADGTDLEITFLMYSETETATDTTFAALQQYWQAAGIKCNSQTKSTAAFDLDIDNNEWYAVLGPHTSIGGLSLKSRVAPFVPVQQAAEWYGEYGTYYGTNGASGVKPVGDFQKLIDIYEKWKATPDAAERDNYASQIYEIHKKNLWTIAYLKSAGTYRLVNSAVHNVPSGVVSDDLYQYANMLHFWAMYKK